MIFVTMGTAPLPFTRLAAEIDSIAPDLGEEVFVQYGHTSFKFCNVKSAAFLNSTEMAKMMREATIIITHGGSGTLSESLQMHKRVVAVPRRQGTEHNHPQADLVRALEAMGYILACYDVRQLASAVERARTHEFSYPERGDASSIINSFLKEVFGERLRSCDS